MPLHCFYTPKNRCDEKRITDWTSNTRQKYQRSSKSLVQASFAEIPVEFDIISFDLIWCIWVAHVAWLFMPIQSKPPAKWETRVLSRLHTGGNPAVRWRIFIRSSINEDMEKFQKIYIWVVCYAILCNFILFCLELAGRVSFSLFPSYDHPKLNHYDIKLPIPGN